jgi:hypothetical protein
MRCTRLLSLLLLALLGLGLASVILPEEPSAAGPHLYDGDEDDDAAVDAVRLVGDNHRHDIGLSAVASLPKPDVGWLPCSPGFTDVSYSRYLCTSLTRAPPISF